MEDIEIPDLGKDWGAGGGRRERGRLADWLWPWTPGGTVTHNRLVESVQQKACGAQLGGLGLGCGQRRKAGERWETVLLLKGERIVFVRMKFNLPEEAFFTVLCYKTKNKKPSPDGIPNMS